MRIELEEFVVCRGKLRAVSGANLTVERQWLGVVGANGSGKTSLLRAIAGRLPAQGGAIRIDAVDRTAERDWRAKAILDEPFNWLDPICAFDTKEALRALVAGHGLTLITALHEMNTLVHHCGSGLLLADGTVSWRLGPGELAVGARDYAAFEAEMIARLRVAAS